MASVVKVVVSILRSCRHVSLTLGTRTLIWRKYEYFKKYNTNEYFTKILEKGGMQLKAETQPTHRICREIYRLVQDQID